MRVLCLNLQQIQESSCAEIFLKLSPRVQFRYPYYVFVDVESTQGLFGGEASLLKKAVELARAVFPQATGAIADTPPVAQLLVNYRPFEITKYGEDFKMVAKLPVAAIQELEGLEPWAHRHQIQQMIQFFQEIGLDWIEDLAHFQAASFRERWGEVGVRLWQRLHGQEHQAISPLTKRDPLMEYVYLDEGCSIIQRFMGYLEAPMQNLFLRLEGLGRFAAKLELQLFCEYSNKKWTFEIQPVSPSRDRGLYLDLVQKKLEGIDLENPIKEFEIYIHDAPEKVEQLDFFEPRDLTEDRWKRLISFAQQAEIEMGFLQMEPSHLPEEGFRLKAEWPRDLSLKDLVRWKDDAIQVKTVYAKSQAESPRPSLLLKEPLALSKAMMTKVKMLTRFPVERIQSSWWKKLTERDYYFGVSTEGQLLWIFQEIGTKKFFLHGYFD